ncbi:nitronate monooxygenase family protein [Staphylococcus aureus]|uniref:NAD(P)H-dependent flavin oxidoreductase n=1 Tax=Staphylococcus aureus TaxID=1280 RepID=UPI0021D1C560|nr:nitronate monooxygenase [Staphylococcus aureus]UXT69879.1 nitronate monooxygenase [Staphylococcus aureus]UXT93890.1 nitronate monooxygenase [Staphylococcus aureus]UXU12208.1 nitronate monooxygenase [Staphylococcus aureus]HEA0067582.1 nitronate monooxygenase [Staphylococcus aureus]HEA0075362.1 nitronate monooxygenase [Staphylococcus aureus]
MENRVSKILNIEKPIIQGPMNGLTNANFVASVSEAGGLGILGPNAGEARITNSPFETAEKMRLEVKKVKKLTSKPFASTIMVSEDLSYTSYLIDMLIEENISAVLINGILDQTIFNKLKENNIKIIFRPLTPTIENAIKSEELGADVFVATGFDEGDTVPEKIIGTFSIIPMIADAIKIPVIAAGGIGDVRGVRAAFCLGAEGVFVGSVLIPTFENPAAENVKQYIVDSNAEDLILFRTIPSYYRSLPGKLARELEEMDKNGATNEELAKHMGGDRNMRLGMLNGDTENGYVSVGTGISPINSIRSTKSVIDDLMQDFN